MEESLQLEVLETLLRLILWTAVDATDSQVELVRQEVFKAGDEEEDVKEDE